MEPYYPKRRTTFSGQPTVFSVGFLWTPHFTPLSPDGSAVKNWPAMQETQETWVWSLGQEDPLEEDMATLSSILAWRIPRTEESGMLQLTVLQRVVHDWSDWACMHTQLNSEFQRIARRDKKVFLNEQWKEIKENNRMEKTRDLFKKIRDTKEIFHAKMGTIDRKSTRLNSSHAT